MRHSAKNTASLIFLITIDTDLALATKSTGGIRWMDGSIREGQRLYVDASSLTSVADGSKVCAYIENSALLHC